MDVAFFNMKYLLQITRCSFVIRRYVKVYLMPDKSQNGKKKTKVVKKNVDPKFDETVVVSIDKV